MNVWVLFGIDYDVTVPLRVFTSHEAAVEYLTANFTVKSPERDDGFWLVKQFDFGPYKYIDGLQLIQVEMHE